MTDAPTDPIDRRLDVRPLLAAGEEPLETILAAAAQIPLGGTLTVIAPFEPKPLYRVLGARGFAHRAEALDAADTAVRFIQTGITGETLVRDVHERYPAAGAVFAEYGLDLCCGGAKPLAVAAAAHGVPLDALVAQLQEVTVS